jgi:hypothetical protein
MRDLFLILTVTLIFVSCNKEEDPELPFMVESNFTMYSSIGDYTQFHYTPEIGREVAIYIKITETEMVKGNSIIPIVITYKEGDIVKGLLNPEIFTAYTNFEYTPDYIIIHNGTSGYIYYN